MTISEYLDKLILEKSIELLNLRNINFDELTIEQISLYNDAVSKHNKIENEIDALVNKIDKGEIKLFDEI